MSFLHWHLNTNIFLNGQLNEVNGELNEEVYMDFPLRYPKKRDRVISKLQKSLYCLRQACR